MLTRNRTPRWGFLDIFLVYFGLLIVGIFFGFYGDVIMNFFSIWGIPYNELSYFTVGFLIQFITTIGLVFLFTLTRKGVRLSDLGIRRARTLDYAKYGLLGGLFLLVLIVVLGYIINYLQPDLNPQVFEEMLRSITTVPGFIILFIIGAVMAPISEELFYRGMIYPVLRKHMGPLWGAILAGIVFGLAHWDFWRTIPLAVGGIILCYIYEKTRSIFVPAVTHGVWNGIMAILVYLSIAKSI